MLGVVVAGIWTAVTNDWDGLVPFTVICVFFFILGESQRAARWRRMNNDAPPPVSSPKAYPPDS